MTATQLMLTLPDWAVGELAQLPEAIPDLSDRITTVIRLSELNYRNGTGGPFGAGVFERDTGKLVSIGVNRVVAMNCSAAHAEFMALSLAQQALNTYDLGGKGMPAHQLVVNWRPCAMCYGNVIWSGIRSLAIAGSGAVLEELTGFDEGPIHPDWIGELNKRGIEVMDNLNREEACSVFRGFRDSGSLVYNARRGE